MRLTPKGYRVGLVDEERYKKYIFSQQEIEKEKTENKGFGYKPQ
jgi:tRNA U34 5-carboxymethylaminomethyl modifying enzyme MnmG/GidA